MKKLLSALIAIAMLCSFTACTPSQGNGSSDAPSASQIEVQTETQAAEEPEVEKLEWVDFAQYSLEEDVPAKNIILLIGDGMGKNIIKASEVVKGDKLVMSGMPHSTTVTTYSQSVTDGKAEYTDSAASATAISTGVKTTNEALGVDPDGEDVETICEFAQKLGMKTGLVARQIMCHATPAGMVIHNTSRGSYPKIMLDMVRSDVDVMFGGGSQYYSEYTKIQSAVQEHKYKYITTSNELKSLSTADGKVLGLFSYDNMGAADMSPSLMKMTAKSLELLDNDKGFFLMVEGSNIDSYEHKSDMETVLGQMQGFDETVDYVLKWAQEHPGTLVIVTADHETGGVQLPENPKPEDINNTCFTSDGNHTNADVPLMTSGAQSAGLCEKELIDNTDIAEYMRKVLSESHK